MWSFRGFIAVVITGAVLSVPLYFYWEFLTQGMRPPAATIRLNELQKNGIPEFSVKKLDGQEIKISDLRGQVTLVNLWATWCGPCVKEFPSLKKLVTEMKGGVKVLAISQDRDRQDIDRFVKAFGGVPEGFILAWDPEKKIGDVFGTEVLPETYILGSDGKLIRKVAGEATWDDPSALDFFRSLK